MSTSKEPSPFEQWYNGMIGFHINSERIIDDLDQYGANAINSVKLRKWMAVCWNQALQEAQDLVYPSHHVEIIEELKEKI